MDRKKGNYWNVQIDMYTSTTQHVAHKIKRKTQEQEKEKEKSQEVDDNYIEIKLDHM